ncbi:MAG TPA: helix-turn-helix domain-containing protein [Candidatus Elarobacter sp.]|nr:helix-turn-helix domain-containing protein [Candidatus Elarobacter sp.]HEV2740216.1 helix-turn-helix domain-containing protein [Candidatus Elarobacter sp.]
MAKRIALLLPPMERRLSRLGERIRKARLRRRLSAKLVAERAGMSVTTLRNVEHGGMGVTIGAYAAILHVLGLAGDLDAVAAVDILGRDLQDAALPRSARTRSES